MQLSSRPSPYLVKTNANPLFKGNAFSRKPAQQDSFTAQSKQNPPPSLLDLPPDIFLELLKSKDLYVQTKDQAALAATCKTLRQIAQTDPQHQNLKQIMALTHKIWQEAPRQRDSLPFALLSPENRQTVIQKALHTKNLASLKKLGPRLQFLEDEQKKQLVQHILLWQDDWAKANAIQGLGSGLQFLNSEQQNQLVQHTLQWQDEGAKASAIAGLGSGLPFLEDEQKKQLVQHILLLQEEWVKASAIEGLAPGLQFLNDEQKNQLVQLTLQFHDRRSKAIAIAGLGLGLLSAASEPE